jgi:hypothetical protein
MKLPGRAIVGMQVLPQVVLVFAEYASHFGRRHAAGRACAHALEELCGAAVAMLQSVKIRERRIGQADGRGGRWRGEARTSRRGSAA